MINELEKQFFDKFGIEPKKQCYYWDCPYSTGNIVNDTPMNERDCNSCKNPDKEIYPQITDHILLELLCLLADLYDSNSHGYPLLSKNIKELKEDVLDDLMGAIDVENNYPEGYANKIRALFKEYNNDR